MKRQTLMALGAGLVATALAGCGGSSNHDNNNGGGGVVIQPPTTTNFTTFVHTQLAATSDTTQPADVNGVAFSYPDDGNAAAFNDVVGTP
ncbi:MAG: hypothetical protein ABIR62_15475 [Dokdonella sp.]|uniref:hypothetical protein n=1 Tax=Dokdonella sp. TaxID=2291710 RepID=UPI003267A5DA